MLQLTVPLPARTDVMRLALEAVAAAGAAAAAHSGVAERSPDAARVAVAYSSERWFRRDGAAPTAFAALSGFFPTADGWVRTHANYPHHARALRAALRLGDDAQRVEASAALRVLTADEAARRIGAHGGLCVAVRPPDAEADERLRAAALVTTERIAPAPAATTTETDPGAPLRGIRVLDLTRVIAGPVATRTLALLGADVLRIDPPHLPEPSWQHLDTGHAKRSTILDVSRGAGKAVFETLLARAHVMVLGYRPAALDRSGLSPARLASLRPGLVVGRLTAWGLPDRRGFDSLVQADTGIARIEESADGAPGALPVQALDHSAGYHLAAAIVRALTRRRTEGGSWLVETSLRRVAAELLGLGRSAPFTPSVVVDPAPHLQTFEVAGSEVVTAAPAIAYDGAPRLFSAPRPWGEDAATWA